MCVCMYNMYVLCMYVYMYVYVCTYMCMYVRIYKYIRMYIHICMYVCIYVCMLRTMTCHVMLDHTHRPVTPPPSSGAQMVFTWSLPPQPRGSARETGKKEFNDGYCT